MSSPRACEAEAATEGAHALRGVSLAATASRLAWRGQHDGDDGGGRFAARAPPDDGSDGCGCSGGDGVSEPPAKRRMLLHHGLPSWPSPTRRRLLPGAQLVSALSPLAAAFEAAAAEEAAAEAETAAAASASAHRPQERRWRPPPRSRCGELCGVVGAAMCALLALPCDADGAAIVADEGCVMARDALLVRFVTAAASADARTSEQLPLCPCKASGALRAAAADPSAPPAQPTLLAPLVSRVVASRAAAAAAAEAAVGAAEAAAETAEDAEAEAAAAARRATPPTWAVAFTYAPSSARTLGRFAPRINAFLASAHEAELYLPVGLLGGLPLARRLAVDFNARCGAAAAAAEGGRGEGAHVRLTKAGAAAAAAARAAAAEAARACTASDVRVTMAEAAVVRARVAEGEARALQKMERGHSISPALLQVEGI